MLIRNRRISRHERSDQLIAFGRHYIRDIVYAANDGIVTTFAAVAGVRGADLSILAVLALGFANLAADGLSMAVGNYLGIKSERATELHRDYQEWPETVHAAKHGAVTWLSFVLAGLAPLVPYLLPLASHEAFKISCVVTGLALFTVGSLRTIITGRRWFQSGLEMLLIGAFAGIAAFVAGWGIATLLGE